jgi:hypothetical protein
MTILSVGARCNNFIGMALRHLCIVLSLFIVSGCAKSVTVSEVYNQQPVKASTCLVNVFSEQKPQLQFTELASINAHIQVNMFGASRKSMVAKAIKELKAKACELGGDAIIITDSIESSAAEFSHLRTWATVIKFNI